MAKQNKLYVFENALKVPFEPDTFKMSIDSLDQYLEDSQSKEAIKIYVRQIGFEAEILVLGVVLDDECEEDVYLRVLESELLVACTVDTTPRKLSRHAYYALTSMMGSQNHYDFKAYYWPDFFEKFGGSKYLDISEGLLGLQVSLKPEFSSFYRPFEKLPYPSCGYRHKKPILTFQSNESVNSNEVPKICFLWQDKGDYFELSYRLKVHGKIEFPVEQNIIYVNDPFGFTIFESSSDGLITSFFAERLFKILVLREHYRRYFKGFASELSKHYELIKIGTNVQIGR